MEMFWQEGEAAMVEGGTEHAEAVLTELLS